MRLSEIEIVVGEPSEKLPTCRHLSYRMSFKDDAGEECQHQHESLVHERALYDSAGIARIVAHVVRGLLLDDAGPYAPDRRSLTSAAERPGVARLSGPARFPSSRENGV